MTTPAHLRLAPTALAVRAAVRALVVAIAAVAAAT
jgi:hypothetical protein